MNKPQTSTSTPSFMAQPGNLAMASASPAPTQGIEQSIEREESADVKTENGDAAAPDAGAPKAELLTPKEHELIKAFVDTLSAYKDEE